MYPHTSVDEFTTMDGRRRRHRTANNCLKYTRLKACSVKLPLCNIDTRVKSIVMAKQQYIFCNIIRSPTYCTFLINLRITTRIQWRIDRLSFCCNHSKNNFFLFRITTEFRIPSSSKSSDRFLTFLTLLRELRSHSSLNVIVVVRFMCVAVSQ